MAITNENLFTESYDSVKSFLNGIVGLDPRGRAKPNWIHSSMPNINDKGFDGYPFIVLSENINEKDLAFDNTISTKVFRVLISIYSKDTLDIDKISNKIFFHYKNETPDFSAKELSSSNISWNMDDHGQKISFRHMGLIMQERI